MVEVLDQSSLENPVAEKPVKLIKSYHLRLLEFLLAAKLQVEKFVGLLSVLHQLLLDEVVVSCSNRHIEDLLRFGDEVLGEFWVQGVFGLVDALIDVHLHHLLPPLAYKLNLLAESGLILFLRLALL